LVAYLKTIFKIIVLKKIILVWLILKKNIQLILLYPLITTCVNAQVNITFTSTPRHTITIYTLNNNAKDGILTQTSDTAVFIYPGNFREWKQRKKIPINVTPFTIIEKIETKQKGVKKVIKGMLIGAGIGLAPVLVGSIFGPSTAEGGAYVSLVAVPLGTIVGAVIGATSKKRFQIRGDKIKFQRFRNKVKK